MRLSRNVVSPASAWAAAFAYELYPGVCKESGKQSFTRYDDMSILKNIFLTGVESITCNFRVKLEIDIVERHISLSH